MTEIIGHIGRAQTLTAELSTPQTITGSLCGGAAHGIPTGGEPGQGLIKVSDADYDVKWMDILPEDTASGSVASFPDGSDDLPMGVVVDIDPVQDLHGYDNPWPAGGGKNLYNEQFRQGSARDLSSTTRIIASESIYVEQGKTYTFSASNYSTFNYVLNSAQADSLPISGSYNYCGAGLDWLARAITFTATNSGYVFVCVRKPDNSDIVPSDVANVKMQFEESSTATAYAPYSNICPISGWTGAKVTRTGINVWDEEWENGTFNTTTGVNNNTGYQLNQIRSKNLIPVIGGASYYFRASQNLDLYTQGMWVMFFDSSKNIITKGLPSGRGSSGNSRMFNTQSITMPNNACYIKFYMTNAYGNAYKNDIAINYPSTDRDYHAYTGEAYNIEFPISAGTVYGGTLDVVTGELVVDRAIVDLGTLNWAKISTTGTHWRFWAVLNAMARNGEMLSSQYKHITATQQYFGEIGIASQSSDINYLVMVSDERFTDGTTFKTAMNGVQLVYELATPITLTLDPVEIRSLIGDNNVFADTGDVSVTYKADIQKYIDKKISAAVAAMS